MNAQRRPPPQALCLINPARPRESAGHAAPYRLIAGFAAQMLGQGGVRRGLQAGPGFITCAHSSYQAGGALAAPRTSPGASSAHLKLSV